MKKILLLITAVLLLTPSAAFAEDTLYAFSVSGELSLHLTAHDDSYVITKIPACSKLTLVETKDTWGRVIFRKKCGWINLSFTADSYKNAAENTGSDSVKTVKVSAEKGKTALYNVPSDKAELGGKEKYNVPNDTILNVTRETESGWGLVAMNEKYAWVRIENTKPCSDFAESETEKYGIYYVYVLSPDGSGIPLMQSPGSGGVYAVIPDCIKLTVREKKGNYGYTSYNGLNGWINLDRTADSLAGAQFNAGEAVNEEYEITAGESGARLLSVPSDMNFDEETALGSIKKGTTVFVLRRTLSGWSLVNHKGVFGWVPPGTLTLKEKTEKEPMQLHDPYDVYVKTPKGKGLSLYTSAEGGGKQFASVPECVRVSVITTFDDMSYVVCDYASGWAKLENNTAADYAASLVRKDKKPVYCRISIETGLKNVPVYSELCGSRDILTLSVGTPLCITATAVTGKRKWGLTEYNGNIGWVNLNCTKETLSPAAKRLILLAVLVLTACAAFIIVRKKMKK